MLTTASRRLQVVENFRHDVDDLYYLRRMKDILQDGFQPRPSPPSNHVQLSGHVFIGSQRNAEDIEQLQKCGITDVLTCALSRRSNESPYGRDSGISGYHVIPAEDREDFDIRRYFEEAIVFLDRVKEDKGKALVHCNMGVNRSGAVVAAYLMVDENRFLLDVIEYLKAKRLAILTNKGFRRQLVQFARSRKLLDPVMDTVTRITYIDPKGKTRRENVLKCDNIRSKEKLNVTCDKETDEDRQINGRIMMPSFFPKLFHDMKIFSDQCLNNVDAKVANTSSSATKNDHIGFNRQKSSSIDIFIKPNLAAAASTEDPRDIQNKTCHFLSKFNVSISPTNRHSLLTKRPSYQADMENGTPNHVTSLIIAGPPPMPVGFNTLPSKSKQRIRLKTANAIPSGEARSASGPYVAHNGDTSENFLSNPDGLLAGRSVSEANIAQMDNNCGTEKRTRNTEKKTEAVNAAVVDRNSSRPPPPPPNSNGFLVLLGTRYISTENKSTSQWNMSSSSDMTLGITSDMTSSMTSDMTSTSTSCSRRPARAYTRSRTDSEIVRRRRDP